MIRWSTALPVALSLALGACSDRSGEAAETALDPNAPPAFRVDPFWPKELPNDWIFGEVAGLAVDRQDHVWIIHRPATLDDRQRGQEGMCCVVAPPVVEFDSAGNVARSWGGPGEGYDWPNTEHGILVDPEDNVWISGSGRGDQLLKFTSDGRFLMQIGEGGQVRGSNDPTALGGPAGMAIDTAANEIYVADGYANRRVIVFDTETGAYKRHWGAYGKPPEDGPLGPYQPGEPASPSFRNPVHGVALSRDGHVYVGDRTNNRIQAFRTDGTFVKEGFVRPETLGSGTAGGVTLSKDPEQRWIYVPDSTNNVVWIVDRSTLETVGHVGRLGTMAGHFYRLHDMDVDSRGILYTGEVNVGKRVQRFVPVSP
jgi:DNA-binding beta-propeller fold protein YncE